MSASRSELGSLSLFSLIGYRRNSCGYCENENGNASYFTTSKDARVEDYEELINRGWRRSGKIYYKQNLERSCCPHYAMRLDPTAFRPRRDQRKAVNSWTNFVLGSSYIRDVARLCPKTKEEKKRRKTTFDLSERIHESEYSTLKRPIHPKTKEPIEPAHRFEVTIESDEASLPKYEVFLKYQMTVHKDPASRWELADFKRFLGSGLSRTTVKKDSRDQKLGSYHQCYRLDGKIIAVAVLDLLPHSISSVYLFYDPAYEKYEFGKLSALREIALVLESPYQYYHMGFYIHSCPKMRYKAEFRPQCLLDPESFTWEPLDDTFRAKLDKRRYVSLSRDRRLQRDLESKTETGFAETPDKDLTLIMPGEEEMSLFDIHMPGVLTPEELQAQVDLDRWRLLFRGSLLIHFEKLVGWEKSDIKTPRSIKAYVAELAAALGPNVVKNSAVVLS